MKTEINSRKQIKTSLTLLDLSDRHSLAYRSMHAKASFHVHDLQFIIVVHSWPDPSHVPSHLGRIQGGAHVEASRRRHRVVPADAEEVSCAQTTAVVHARQPCSAGEAAGAGASR